MAERTVKDKATITRFLIQMENKRLITRRASKIDGRSKNVFLTSNGQQLKPILINITKGLLAEAAIGLSTQDLQTTFTTLQTIENNLLSIEN